MAKKEKRAKKTTKRGMITMKRSKKKTSRKTMMMNTVEERMSTMTNMTRKKRLKRNKKKILQLQNLNLSPRLKLQRKKWSPNSSSLR